jgi:hypothetical protein
MTFPYYIYQALSILTVISVVALVAIAVKLIFYRKHMMKKGDIIHNMTENTKHIVSGHKNGEVSLMAKRIVNLPKEFSPREMRFIENEYMEEGINQLKQANQRECFIRKDPSQLGTKFVDVADIKVNFKTRNNKTLEIEDKQEFRTVKLLLLNEWIR